MRRKGQWPKRLQKRLAACVRLFSVTCPRPKTIARSRGATNGNEPDFHVSESRARSDVNGRAEAESAILVVSVEIGEGALLPLNDFLVAEETLQFHSGCFRAV